MSFQEICSKLFQFVLLEGGESGLEVVLSSWSSPCCSCVRTSSSKRWLTGTPFQYPNQGGNPSYLGEEERETVNIYVLFVVGA